MRNMKKQLALDQASGTCWFVRNNEGQVITWNPLFLVGIYTQETELHMDMCVCESTILPWEISLNCWVFLAELKPEGFSNFKYLYEQEYCTISVKHLWTEDTLKPMYLLSQRALWAAWS